MGNTLGKLPINDSKEEERENECASTSNSEHISTHEFNSQIFDDGDICKRKLRKKNYQRNPVMTHEGDSNPKYKFKREGRWYTSKRNLKNQMLTHGYHPNQKYQFVCDICKQRFTPRGSSKCNMSIHKYDVDLKCQGKSTTHIEKNCKSKFDLEYEFKCNVCEKQFSRKCNLKTHMFIHESNPELKYRFKCDVCARGFIYKCYLKTHMLTHECNPELKYQFKCDVCERGFVEKYNLKIHMLRHEHNPELKHLFKCDVCEKRLTSKGNLKRHMSRIHKC